MATTLFYEMTFEAAHRLPNVPEGHPCSRLHGHNYRIEIEVQGPVDPKLGWVCDFAELDATAKPFVAALDHRFLNEIEGLHNPTAEWIARWLFERIQPKLASLQAIIVHENTRSRCRYDGP